MPWFCQVNVGEYGVCKHIYLRWVVHSHLSPVVQCHSQKTVIDFRELHTYEAKDLALLYGLGDLEMFCKQCGFKMQPSVSF